MSEIEHDFGGSDPTAAKSPDIDANMPFLTPVGLMTGLEFISRDQSRCTMLARPVAPALEAGTGRIHPGAITVLADQCMGNAATGERRRALATLDLRIDLFASPTAGSPVQCEARAVGCHGQTVFVSADILDASTGHLIGYGTGEFMVGAAAGGFKDINSYEASLKKYCTDVSLHGIDCFETYLDMPSSDGNYILGPADRFIGSLILPALHGGITAAALRQAMSREAKSWRPPGTLHMLSWSTHFLVAGKARKALRISTQWVRQGRNVAILQASAFQEASKGPVAIAQATFTALAD